MNNGKHILAEFWQCDCPSSLLCQIEPLRTLLSQAVTQAGLTLVGQAYHEFSPSLDNASDCHKDFGTIENTSPQPQTSGVTLTLLLAESHICLHTWGELGTVTLDIYVCNFLSDNSDKAEQLLTACEQIFLPKDKDVKSIWRTHKR